MSIDQRISLLKNTLGNNYDYYSKLKTAASEADVHNQYAKSCPSYTTPDIYDFSSFGSFTNHHHDSERFFQIRKNAIRDYLGIPEHLIHLADHHTCHAVYAYAASPFRGTPTLVFTADCVGDDVSATVWQVDENSNREHSYPLPEAKVKPPITLWCRPLHEGQTLCPHNSDGGNRS